MSGIEGASPDASDGGLYEREIAGIAVGAPPAPGNTRRRRSDFRLLSTACFLGLVVLVFSLITPAFLSRNGWFAVCQAGIEILLLGLGQGLVIMSGQIDLSVGSMLGLSGMCGGLMMKDLLHSGLGPAETMAVGYAFGILCGGLAGFLNGVLVTRLRLAPFIVTLATLDAYAGVTDLLHNGTELISVPPQVSTVGNYAVGNWMPIPIIIGAALYVLVAIWLGHTRAARHLYAIGSSAESAARAGINVDRMRVMVFVISGVLAGIAGVLVLSIFVGASPVAGSDQLLNAIAAPVIGGVSFSGGRGSASGIALGVGLISVITVGLIIVAELS
jgi:ribose transport system permease protein